MQESIHIQLLDQTIQAIVSDDEKKIKYIDEELHQHERAINNLILSYYFMERKRVYDLIIDTESMEIDRNGHGSFKVQYMLGLFNACADKDMHEPSYMKILLKADFNTQIMILTGEDIPERDPDGL